MNNEMNACILLGLGSEHGGLVGLTHLFCIYITYHKLHIPYLFNHNIPISLEVQEKKKARFFAGRR